MAEQRLAKARQGYEGYVYQPAVTRIKLIYGEGYSFVKVGDRYVMTPAPRGLRERSAAIGAALRRPYRLFQ